MFYTLMRDTPRSCNSVFFEANLLRELLATLYRARRRRSLELFDVGFKIFFVANGTIPVVRFATINLSITAGYEWFTAEST